MIPTLRLLGLLWLLLGLALAASIYAELHAIWLWSLGTLLAIALIDALSTLRPAPISVERMLPSSLPLGVWRDIKLRLHNEGRRRVSLDVFDHFPLVVDAIGMPQHVELKPEHHADLGYRIRANERGEFTFPHTQIRQYSMLRLWRRNRRIGGPSVTNVYPNFAAVSKYILLAMDNRLSQMGILKRRRRGEGQDFHQLREYRLGDSPRQVDWKATSRMRKLISREYQDERDQEVVFLIDCGHRMFTKDDSLSHFDHTLNAVLLLAYVALRQGDAVGLGTFSGQSRWLPPFKGAGMVNRILNTVYDLQPSLQAPDYSEAAMNFLVRQKKRALVIVITNLRDEDSDDLLPALQLLRKRHLVLLTSMQEKALNDVLEAPVNEFEDALRLAATHDYLGFRRATFDKIRASGILSMDVVPQELSVALVNRYLEIKGSGAL